MDTLHRVGRALADDSRRRMIVSMLDGIVYPADLADHLDMTRANVSNHLACLRGCGLVLAAPEGRRVRYEFADPDLAEALRTLASIKLGTDDGCDSGEFG